MGREIHEITDIFVAAQGREYGKWARGAHSEGDKINNPVGVIESIIRDEIHTERDLQADSGFAVIDHIELPDAQSSEDDYYNGCYINNITADWTIECDDYTGSLKRFEFATPKTTSSGDNVFLTNVNCNLDTTTFDNAETARSGWVFTGSLTEKLNSADLLNELLFESHCILPPSGSNYRLIPIDTGTSIATFGRPLSGANGFLIEKSGFTSPLSIYTDFRLEYAYDYARGAHTKEAFVNKNAASGSITSGYKTKCENAEKNYKVKRKYEYQCKWIAHQATAEALLMKLIDFRTTQRHIFEAWYGYENYIQYEIGDLVKINFDDINIIPSTKNNSAIYMITKKKIRTTKGQERILFRLEEMI